MELNPQRQRLFIVSPSLEKQYHKGFFCTEFATAVHGGKILEELKEKFQKYDRDRVSTDYLLHSPLPSPPSPPKKKEKKTYH